MSIEDREYANEGLSQEKILKEIDSLFIDAANSGEISDIAWRLMECLRKLPEYIKESRRLEVYESKIIAFLNSIEDPELVFNALVGHRRSPRPEAQKQLAEILSSLMIKDKIDLPKWRICIVKISALLQHPVKQKQVSDGVAEILKSILERHKIDIQNDDKLGQNADYYLAPLKN